MESNITDQQFWSSNSPLAAPHFDQEATLLSARPVVPINRHSMKPGFSRGWLLGFALAGTLLLGVLATALYYTLFTGIESQPVRDAETVSSGVQGFASESVDERPKEPSEATRPGKSSDDSNTSAMANNGKPSASQTTHPLNTFNVPRTSGRQSAVVVDQSSDFDENRAMRRAARKEAREQKRANHRRQRGKHSDDLLRIRDIFEGPSRP